MLTGLIGRLTVTIVIKGWFLREAVTAQHPPFRTNIKDFSGMVWDSSLTDGNGFGDYSILRTSDPISLIEEVLTSNKDLSGSPVTDLVGGSVPVSVALVVTFVSKGDVI